MAVELRKAHACAMIGGDRRLTKYCSELRGRRDCRIVERHSVAMGSEVWVMGGHCLVMGVVH